MSISTSGTLEESKLRIMAAKIVAQGRWPYLSTIIFSLKLIPTQDLPTLAVDNGWRMYYNPEFVLQQSAEVLATMVLHEALHCINQHGKRFESLNQPAQTHDAWNMSGDANINQTLDEANFPWGEFLPVRFETLETYGVEVGMTTETAFFNILKYFEKHPDAQKNSNDCGSVSGGQSRGYEAPKNDASNPAIKNDQQDVIRDRVAQEILKNFREKGAGSVPGNLLRWAQDLLEPQVKWQTVLAGAVRASLANSTGRKDYVFTRPSRRQGINTDSEIEIVLPAMRKPTPPSIAVIIDTSGSVLDSEINIFLTEVEAVARANGVASNISVIPCDSVVGEVMKIKSAANARSIQLKGGGGTDLREGFKAAIKLKPVPKIILVFTDGYTEWPNDLPSKIESTIICCTAEENLNNLPKYSKGILITIEK